MNKLQKFWLLSLALCMVSFALNAQDAKEKDSKKKMVIIKKTVDKDGNEKVEKIVKEGNDEAEMIWINDDGEVIELEEGNFQFFEDGDENIESIDVIKLKDGEELPEDAKKRLEELEISIDQIQDGQKHIRIKKLSDGEEEKVIEWEGDMTDDVLKRIHDEGLHIEHIEGDGKHTMIVHADAKHNNNQAFLGVTMNRTVEVINENGEEQTIEETGEGDGVQIGGVIDGSGAANAGLQEGDILRSIDGEAINTFGELVEALEDKSPGDVIAVTYERDEASNTVDVTLGSHEGLDLGDMEEEIEIHIDGDGEGFEEENVFFLKDKGTAKKKIIIIEKTDDGEEIMEIPEMELERSLDLSEIDIFPNPTSGSVRLQFKAPAINTVVRVTDVSGRELYREELAGFNGSYDNTIDLGQASKGALLLSIQQKDKIFTEKIILK